MVYPLSAMISLRLGKFSRATRTAWSPLRALSLLAGMALPWGTYFRWEHPEGQVVGVSVPGGAPGGDDDVSVVAGERSGGGFVGGGAVPAQSLAVGASDQPVS